MSDGCDKWRKNTSGSESWLDVSEFAWICSSLHNSDPNLNTFMSEDQNPVPEVTAVVKICRPSVSLDFRPFRPYSFWASMKDCCKYAATAVSSIKFTLLSSYYVN